MSNSQKTLVELAHSAKKLVRRLRTIKVGPNHDLPDWRWLNTKLNTGGPRVLIANSVPAFRNSLLLDSSLAAALTLRGAQVDTLMCDRVLDACFNCKFTRMTTSQNFANDKWRDIDTMCARCDRNSHVFSPNITTPLQYSDYTDPEDQSLIAEFIRVTKLIDLRSAVFNGVNVGEHAFAGVARYFATGEPAKEESFDVAARKFLSAACQTALIMRRVIEKRKPDVVVLHHAIYVPQGVICEVAQKAGVRVVSWTPSYRAGTFIFAHGDTYHRTMLSDDSDSWKYREMNLEQRLELVTYLKSRETAKNDWIWFNSDNADLPSEVTRLRSGGSFDYVVSVFPNVYWDAQIHFSNLVFTGLMDWIRETIELAKRRPRHAFVIRAHPAEVTGMMPSRHRLIDAIKDEYPNLPSNVFLIASENPTSSYKLAEFADVVVVYGSKLSIELAALGKPVVVCGDAWARGRGFTFDVESRTDYLDAIERALQSNSTAGNSSRVDLAQRFAYHFFFRRMIPFEIAQRNENPSEGAFSLSVKSAADLSSRAKGVETICKGILTGSEFIYECD